MNDERKKPHSNSERPPQKGTASNNYKPITCLPRMWKIQTAKIWEEICDSLISRGLFPEKQKGCRKGYGGTDDLLYIDQYILNESKTRRKNLVYDRVPQSWIIHCLKMFKISDEVIKFIERTQEN